MTKGRGHSPRPELLVTAATSPQHDRNLVLTGVHCLLTSRAFSLYAMTTQTLTPPSRAESERENVTSWRVERLLAAGYDAEASLVLALDRDVDLHLAVSLLERGCPPDTALQILF